MPPSPRRTRHPPEPTIIQWEPEVLGSWRKVLAVLIALQGKRWVCRGQSEPWNNLRPKIDRDQAPPVTPKERAVRRMAKLTLERRSINIFRSTARYFTDEGERDALGSDITTLMVLRHYLVPCRLLDWSLSPFVAAYFAVDEHGNDSKDGELWAFEHERYRVEGAQQWRRWPETTEERSGDPARFVADLTAFLPDNPPDWFVCHFYPRGFARQRAQHAFYSMTAHFDRDHADAIARLLGDPTYYRRYIIRARDKKRLRAVLRDQHGIWQGALYPDSAGAARIAAAVFPKKPRR